MSSALDTTLAPIAGRQDLIRGTGTPPDSSPMPPLLTGVAWPTGTYNFLIPVSGAGAVDVVLRTSAATGTGLSSTATIAPLLADGTTLKGSQSTAAAVFVNGTAQVLNLTGLRGERFVNLRLVVPGASTVTFDLAEYSTPGSGAAPGSGVSGTATATLQPSLIGAADASGNLRPVNSTTPNADGKGLGAINGLLAVCAGYLFNGAAWDQVRAATAAALAGFTTLGTMLVSRPGDWGQGHTPAAATQATTSKAAGAAGVRHVCTSISATLATGATAQAAAAIVVLRDGATGAGTILWTKQVILPVNAVWELNLSDLNLVGSAATAMTLEFTAAGAAGTFESVSMTGHEAS